MASLKINFIVGIGEIEFQTELVGHPPQPMPTGNREKLKAAMAGIRNLRKICFVVPASELPALAHLRRAKEEKSVIESFEVVYFDAKRRIDDHYVFSVEVQSLVPSKNGTLVTAALKTAHLLPGDKIEYR